MDVLALGIAWYAVFIVSTTFHEAAHAFAALKLGDKTAYLGGQVSLDPVPHIRREPIGMVAIPFLSYLAGGWMIGWASVPLDPFWAERYPKRAALMALAGPGANFALLLIAGLLLRLGLSQGWFMPPEQIDFVEVTLAATNGFKPLAIVLSILFTLNLVLFIFNTIPLPPLDGSTMMVGFMPPEAAGSYRRMFRHPGAPLVGLIIAWLLFSRVFWPIFLFFINLLYRGYAYYG
jgi:Zn-dependent protease